jgi:hypothetical protein
MKGITYVRDEQNHLKAVQIDAELYGEVLEDFLDGLEAEALKKEPKKDFDEVAQRILAKRKQANV